MDQAQFETLLSKARGLQDAERLQFLQKDLSQQCLAPNQIKLLGDLFQDEQTRQTYAQVALPSNADPDNFPYDMKDLAVADPTIDRIEDGLEDNPQERVNTELDLQTKDVAEARSDAPIEAVEAVEDVPTPEPVAKTKAEIRAEKRLAKAQARAEKKAAKAKARAEKKAAKARAKAERTNNK